MKTAMTLKSNRLQQESILTYTSFIDHLFALWFFFLIGRIGNEKAKQRLIEPQKQKTLKENTAEWPKRTCISKRKRTGLEIFINENGWTRMIQF